MSWTTTTPFRMPISLGKACTVAPSIAFAPPGSGIGRLGRIGPVTAVSIHIPDWWSDATPSLPVTSADGTRKVWSHGAYSVVTRDRGDGNAQLFLRDSTSREWP